MTEFVWICLDSPTQYSGFFAQVLVELHFVMSERPERYNGFLSGLCLDTYKCRSSGESAIIFLEILPLKELVDFPGKIDCAFQPQAALLH